VKQAGVSGLVSSIRGAITRAKATVGGLVAQAHANVTTNVAAIATGDIAVVVNQRWRLIWALAVMLWIFLEGMGLGSSTPGETLSDVVRGDVRFDPIGRFPLLVIWCWLSWHWIIAPRAYSPSPTWRDVVAASVGLAWAITEQLLGYAG
jgi:hypothetical protein